MAKVLYLGNSLVQLESLPPEVRVAFEWAIAKSGASPTALPRSAKLRPETKRLAGPLSLFAITVRPRANDPGYRGGYIHDGWAVLFVRFAHRDASTYKRLR